MENINDSQDDSQMQSPGSSQNSLAGERSSRGSKQMNSFMGLSGRATRVKIGGGGKGGVRTVETTNQQKKRKSATNSSQQTMRLVTLEQIEEAERREERVVEKNQEENQEEEEEEVEEDGRERRDEWRNYQPLIVIPANQSVSTAVEGIDQNAQIIDIPLEKLMGVLSGIKNGYDFFPEKQLNQIRSIYISVLSKIEKAEADSNAEDLNYWIKFLILIPLVVGNQGKNQKSKGDRNKDNIKFLVDAVDKMELDLKLTDLRKKDTLQTHLMKTEKMIFDRVDLLLSEGDIHRAGRALNNSVMVPRSMESYEIIKKQFPIKEEILIQGIEAQKIESIKIKSLPKEINLDRNKIVEIIGNLNSTVTAGPDQFSNKMVKQLIGKTSNKTASESEFIDLLVRFLGRMAGGKMPDNFYYFLRDVEVIGIPKGNAPVNQVLRTISKPVTWRKLMVAPMIMETKADLKVLFGDLQYAFTNDGVTKIVNSVSYAMQADPSLTIANLDGINAFNAIGRERGLLQLMDLDEKWLPLMSRIYGTDSSNWYVGCPDYIKSCIGEVGAQQGCTAGSLFFCLAIHQLVQSMNSLNGNPSLGIVKCFVDDIVSISKFAELIKQLQFITEEGPKYGYNLNLKKCKFMLGLCENNEEAFQQKQQLMELGFEDSNIDIHPDNDGNKEKYGMKLLGSYVGSNEFIQLGLQEKIQELEEESRQLLKYFDVNPQGSMILLTKSFSRKTFHLYRTIQPSIMKENFNAQWEAMIEKCFFAACGNPRMSATERRRAWDQFRLKPENGGHGIAYYDDIAVAAFIASQVEFFEAAFGARGNLAAICGNLPNMLLDLESNNPLIQIVQDACKFIEEIDPTKTISVISQMKSSSSRSLQGQLTDILSGQRLKTFINKLESEREIARLAWFMAQQNSDGNYWIDQIPKRGDQQTIMTKKEFNAAMCSKYFLQQPTIPTDRLCACGKRPDVYGQHLIGGCAYGGDRQNTHDSIKFLVKSFLFWAGFFVTVEPRNMFDNNLRPDLRLNNPPPSVSREGRALAMDISVASLLPGTSLGTIPREGSGATSATMSLAQAKDVNRHLTKRVDEKNRKYHPSTAAAGTEFLALVFGTSGRMDKGLTDFIRKVSKVASEERQIPADTLYRYWIRSISFRFQKELAASIVRKSIRMRLGGLDHGGAQGNTFTNEYVLECERVVERVRGKD